MSIYLVQEGINLWTDMMGGHGDPYAGILPAAVLVCIFLGVMSSNKGNKGK